MKRSITLACLLISMAALLVVSILTLNLAARSEASAQQARLKQLIFSMRFSSAPKGYAALAKSLHAQSGSPAVRVTFFSSSGDVLGDSAAHPSANGLHFREVKQSQESGYAESNKNGFVFSRFSCALALSGGRILRLSTTANCLGPALSLMLFPLLAGVFLVLILLPAAWSVVLGQVYTAGQAVLDCLRGALKGRRRPLTTDEDEFKPIVHSINDALEQYLSQLKGAEDRSRNIESVLSSMKEGLVVLDPSLAILTINQSAKEVFRAGADCEGQNLLRLTHHTAILEAAGSASRDGVRTSVDYVPPFDPNRIFQVFVSPLNSLPDGRPAAESGGPHGVILLLSDVTSVRKTEKIRSDFVANASHELKTPLTAIRGFAELIESQAVTDPEQVQRYLGLIRKESDRLILLIGDVLRLSELEGRALDSDVSAVSLRIIAQKASLALRAQAQEKSVSLRVQGGAGMIQANPDRMMQLLLNLMENAVKYNKPGGSVEVFIMDDTDDVRFSVTDTGMGIPPEDKERVFERFFRVEQSHATKIPGTGLGLSIVKHIVELYGGSIDLQSKPGTGTTVTVTFPQRGTAARIGQK